MSQKMYLIKQNNAFQAALHNILWNNYLGVIKEEPKDPAMSKSLYLTCVALRILEKMGNTYPSQDEISAVETIVKCFQRDIEKMQSGLRSSQLEPLHVAA